MWNAAPTAPYELDIELAVIDRDGPHALIFPCRRVEGGWVKAESGDRLDVNPTHWRPWNSAVRDS